MHVLLFLNICLYLFLRRVRQETKALLFGKSQEALGLYARNNDLRTEVEKLKEELAEIDEEVARLKEELAQKDELLQKTKEDLMSDAVESYMVGFEDAIAEAKYIYPESDFSQLGVRKIVVDG